jgi:hypothetical protein
MNNNLVHQVGDQTKEMLVILSKVLIFTLPTIVKRDLVPPSPENTVQIV